VKKAADNIYINEEICNSCKECLKVCSYDAIAISNKKVKISLERCTLCKLCLNSCRYNAIVCKELSRKVFKDYRGVWVFIEYQNNSINKACLQILSSGYNLAKKIKEDLTAVVVGKNFDNPDEIGNLLSQYGTKNIKLLQCRDLGFYFHEDVANIIAEEIIYGKPNIVLFLGSNIGRSIAPRVAAHIKTGLTADCTDLDIDEDNNLVQVRPTYGGRILASILCLNSRPQMASVRPNIFENKKMFNTPKKVKTFFKEIEIESIARLKNIVNTVNLTCKEKPLEIADRIVCGGFGVGSKKGFELLQLFASKIGASLGGTRAAVDRGWIDVSQQIGQTGKIIRPELYIGCGVSGAIHHLIGMRNSRKIVAINKDAKAPILKVADIVFIGDIFEVLPKLINKCNNSFNFIS
jgi:electron transfer flavoprotein alpha subunit/NAD-dependent dihydropyrimidine dehydrogenase PreA subunit